MFHQMGLIDRLEITKHSPIFELHQFLNICPDCAMLKS